MAAVESDGEAAPRVADGHAENGPRQIVGEALVGRIDAANSIEGESAAVQSPAQHPPVGI